MVRPGILVVMAVMDELFKSTDKHSRHVDKPKYRNLPRGIKNIGLNCGFHIEDKVRWVYEQATTSAWVYKQMDEILIKFAK